MAGPIFYPSDWTYAKSKGDFSKPDQFCDIALVVQGFRLHTSRALLVAWSPVFRKMFTSTSQEGNDNEVDLPGKRYADVKELLCCITPTTDHQVSDDNVDTILSLAHEWEMHKLKKDCEAVLVAQLVRRFPYVDWHKYDGSSVCPSTDMGCAWRLLMVAQSYNLEHLLEESSKRVAHCSVNGMRCRFANLTHETRSLILEKRCIGLESQCSKNVGRR